MKKYEMIGKYYDMCNELWVELENSTINLNSIIQFNSFDELEEWVENNHYEFFGVNYIVKRVEM